MPAAARCGACEGARDGVGRGHAKQEPEPPRLGEQGARPEQEPGAEGQRAAHVREHAREPRDHESQEDDHPDGRDHAHEGGVEQRRADLGPQLGAFFHVLGEAREHDVECAAQLAGRDHGDEERIEVPRVLGEGVCDRGPPGAGFEGGAPLHGAAHLADRVGESVMPGVLGRERKRPVERHAGAQQRGGVAGPESHGRAATEAPPEARAGGGRRLVHRHGIQALAAQVLEHRLPRGRLHYSFHHLPVRCGSPVAEPHAHPSASSRVTRRTSSSVVVPTHAFAQPAARSDSMPCACASVRISASGVRFRTRSRSSSLIGISS